MLPLLLKAVLGVISVLYGSYLLHDVAHEIDKENLAKYVFIIKQGK